MHVGIDNNECDGCFVTKSIQLLLATLTLSFASCSTRDVLSFVLEGSDDNRPAREIDEWDTAVAPQQMSLGETDPTLVLWAELGYLREELAAGKKIDRERLDRLIAKIDALVAKHDPEDNAEGEIGQALSDAKLAALSIGAETMPDRYEQLRDEYFRSLFQADFDPTHAAAASVKRLVTEHLNSDSIGQKTLSALRRHITAHPDCEMNVELYVATVERLSSEDKINAAITTAREGLKLCAKHKDIGLLDSRLNQVYSEHPGEPGTPMQFTSPRLRGGRFDLKSLRGHPVLVTFWATWCPGCRSEAPIIKKLHDRYSADGLQVVGVSLDTDRDALADFVGENRMLWPQTFSAGSSAGWSNPIAKHYGVKSIPSVFLLDAEGTIVAADLSGEFEIESTILDHLADVQNEQ